MLGPDAGDVGQDGNDLHLGRGVADASQGQAVPAGMLTGHDDLQFALKLSAGFQFRGGLGHDPVDARVVREQGVNALPGRGAGCQTEHALKATIAAQHDIASHVGNAGRRAVQNGAQLVQQLLLAEGFICAGLDGRGHVGRRRGQSSLFLDRTQEAAGA